MLVGMPYPTSEGGTPVLDPKLLGGSKGYAGWTCGHELRPPATLHAFQKVHLVEAAAPGMPVVTAWRK